MRFAVLGLFGLAMSAYADPVVHAGAVRLDRPTMTSLGVVLPVTGDDNFNASVTLRYRLHGSSNWNAALPLLRVHPETVAGRTVEPQFAGSVFDLRPGKNYDLELHLTDPDGSVNQTFTVSATTRNLPAYPVNPNPITVSDASQLRSVMANAKPGDVITIANGTYHGEFFAVYGTGTAENPIVIRGESQNGTILDSDDCGGCNTIEVYGSYTYIENLTIQHAERALRFQSGYSVGNVVRRVTVHKTQMGFHSRQGNSDFYIADNVLDGILQWPAIYSDDNGRWSGWDAIAIDGQGHVIAHNRISGYADAMKLAWAGSRAVDFNNNDVLWSYDNGIELDTGEGNVRAFRNRFTNVYSPLSAQPVFGGPAYMLRNVMVNTVDEPFKMHGAPSGVLAYNNTVVSRNHDLVMETEQPAYNYVIANNLFIGPPVVDYGQAVLWYGPGFLSTVNHNAYFPDGGFEITTPATGYRRYPNFAALQASGVWESQGMLLTGSPFANGLLGTDTYQTLQSPQDVTLSASSQAVDHAILLPNVNDDYKGAGPDLGAWELGCQTPLYGPRPLGMDESNEPLGCNGDGSNPGGNTGGNSGQGQQAPSVSVWPSSASVAAGSSRQFVATLTGLSNTAVTWTLSGPGLISATGLYTAPLGTGGVQTATITATSVADPTLSANATLSLFTPAFTSGLVFVPIAPCRVVDTRGDAGLTDIFAGSILPSSTSRTFPLPSGRCGLPSTAQAYSVNVTVVPDGPLGYLTLSAAGQYPVGSTLNSPDGQIVANAAIVPADSNGAISVFVTDRTQVIIDVNGYFEPQNANGLEFYPIAPCRVADTRNANGPFGGPGLSNNSRDFSIAASSCNVPAGAKAYAANVTAVPSGPLFYLTAWPTGQAQPSASTLNALNSSVVANAAIIPAGANGSISLGASGKTDVVLDVDGYFAAPSAAGLHYYPIAPCRTVDTRSGSGYAGTFGGTSFTDDSSRDIPLLSGACNIPRYAKALAMNVTVDPHGKPLYFLTLWPSGQPQPLVSTLNSPAGKVTANAAIVPLGANGSVSVYATNATDLIIDINGYFAP